MTFLYSTDQSTTFDTLVGHSACFLGCNWLVIAPTEPLEHDLAVQVEYDMDEQGLPETAFVGTLLINLLDHEWLDAVNADRKKEQLDKVSYETFEIIMDRLEKEWFDLVSLLLSGSSI